MKRTPIVLFAVFVLLNVVTAQPTPEATKMNAAFENKQQAGGEDFDKKWRFGLRFTPQFTWFSSKEKNLESQGSIFGYGFGLHLEYRFSETVGLVTGIGGDFEGGKYKVNYDTANGYAVRYWLNNEADFQQPENGKAVSNYRKQGFTEYVLNERIIKTSYITIPAILKMSTKELSGFKYSGIFGGEIGIRLNTLAEDTYHESYTFDANGLPVKNNVSSQAEINMADDTPLIPMRLGMNLGLGAEYRLSGNTSFMLSVNYFHSFVNVLKPTSESMVSSIEPNGSVNNYTFVKQGMVMRAVRINLGILF
ncbi:MAG: outer membrane beta-barrel protein [Bacteroidia bacterium]|nr:outer membrane beta-barrel protein [Bacteroidia bacterium]